MDTSKSPRRRARAFSQWDALRAARAFYGRPLAYDEIQKIKSTYLETVKREAHAETPPSRRPAALPPRATFIG